MNVYEYPNIHIYTAGYIWITTVSSLQIMFHTTTNMNKATLMFFPQSILNVLSVLTVLAFLVASINSSDNTSDVHLNYSMTEELPAGVRIGNLAIDSRPTTEHGHENAGYYRFSLLPSVFREFFDVDPSHGTLRTSAKLFDRDVLCMDKVDCVAHLDVYVAKGRGVFQLVKVRIFVEDINDHSPRFPADHLVLYVPEATLPGTAFAIPPAGDLDSGAFGVADYVLQGARSSAFRLENSSHDPLQLHLVLQETLDRESENGLFFHITAFDGGTPPRNGSLSVQVVVQDANDNSPVFEQKIYNITTEEGKVIDGALIRVSATDPDEGDNGRPTYDFNQATKNAYGSEFSIDNITGDIFLLGRLDFERRSLYELVVTARDMGFGSLPGSATVVINLKDVNDNPPSIYVWGEALLFAADEDSANKVSVLEGQPPGAFIAQIYATDPDIGKNGEVDCRSTSENFNLSRGTDTLSGLFTLTSLVSLDRETTSEYSVELECADHGDPPLRSRQTVTVIVLDVNDNVPRFTVTGMYLLELPENSPPGKPLLRIQALDEDLSDNGQVSYELRGNSSNHLVIDRDTGVLSTGTIPVDRELIASLDFWVVALDHGKPRLASTARLIVQVIDTNDEKPRFLKNEFTYFCPENSPSGTPVGTVTATDADQSPFDAFLFSIIPDSFWNPQSIGKGNTFAAENSKHPNTIQRGPEVVEIGGDFPFGVDSVTGRIFLKERLDRERKSFYRFQVIATNVESPYLSSASTVTVQVIDVNDNPPVIQFVDPGENIVVPIDLLVGSTVFRVVATDADELENSKLQYSIVDGNESKFFLMDSDTGEVHLSRTPPYWNWNDSFCLFLEVSDSGHPKLTVPLNVSLKFVPGSNGSALIYQRIDRLNETILIVVLGVASCVIAILIVAIFYTRRLQMEITTRTKRGMAGKRGQYLDVTAAIMLHGGVYRRGTPSPRFVRDYGNYRGKDHLEKFSQSFNSSDVPSKQTPTQMRYAAQSRFHVSNPQTVENRHETQRPTGNGNNSSPPSFQFLQSLSTLTTPGVRDRQSTTGNILQGLVENRSTSARLSPTAVRSYSSLGFDLDSENSTQSGSTVLRPSPEGRVPIPVRLYDLPTSITVQQPRFQQYDTEVRGSPDKTTNSSERKTMFLTRTRTKNEVEFPDGNKDVRIRTANGLSDIDGDAMTSFVTPSWV